MNATPSLKSKQKKLKSAGIMSSLVGMFKGLGKNVPVHKGKMIIRRKESPKFEQMESAMMSSPKNKMCGAMDDCGLLKSCDEMFSYGNAYI